MSERKPLTEYGIKVNSELMRIGKTQAWLIEEVRAKTGRYVDCSNLNKIFIGSLNSKPIINAINQILGISST